VGRRHLHKWAEDIYKSPYLNSEIDSGQLKSQLENGDFALLSGFSIPDEVAVPGEYLQLTVQGCSNCQNFQALDVNKVKVTSDDKGKVKEDSNVEVDNLLIPLAVYQSITGAYSAEPIVEG
jgi:hypothetical protein